jgi:hypothetical protein
MKKTDIPKRVSKQQKLHQVKDVLLTTDESTIKARNGKTTKICPLIPSISFYQNYSSHLIVRALTCNKLSHCLFDFDCVDFNAYQDE